MIRIGPYTFDYIPDGDDPGTGWLAVNGRVRLQTTRYDWQEFEQATSATLADTDAEETLCPWPTRL